VADGYILVIKQATTATTGFCVSHTRGKKSIFVYATNNSWKAVNSDDQKALITQTGQ